MKLIGTHDSATGEKPTWWSALLTPFARTQSKTIKEQYDAGCRLFDIRVKKVLIDWRCAHGWWFTKRTFESIVREINSFPEKCSITITFEGKTKNAKGLISYIKFIKESYNNIKYGPVYAKYGKESEGLKVKYDVLLNGDPNWTNGYQTKQAFLPLDGKHWQTYIPIPWLWKQFYFKKVEFNEEYYQYVDFL